MTQLLGASMAQDPTGPHDFVLRGRTENPDQPGVFRVHKLSAGRATLLALFGLVVVFGTALAVMTGVGAVLHALDPGRPFDAYAVFHNEGVVLCLIGLSALWLLPPHPWAKEFVAVLIRDDPEPRIPEPVTGKARVAVVSVYQGRAPPSLRAVA